ncbi:60S ribosomal protein L18a-like protein [Linum grandiflorum]
MTGEGEGRGLVAAGDNSDKPYYYGTFQGVANYHQHPYTPPPPPPSLQQPQPTVGFVHPVGPPHNSVVNHPYYPHGYHAITTGYVLADGRPLIREHPLPCCGMGMGWFLFIIGFFIGGIPWYIGALVLLFAQVDYREKPGYVACVIASIIALVVVMMGVTQGADAW